MKNEELPENHHTIKANDFMEMLQISPNTFKKLLDEGRLPDPLPLGTRCRRWSRVAVVNFLQKL